MRNPQLLLILGLLAVISGCTSGDVYTGGNGGDGGSENNATTTMIPMNFFESDYGDLSRVGYKNFLFNGNVIGYLIAPVNEKTKLPVSNPSINDFSITINNASIESDNKPIFQQVMGLPVNLKTALVVDVSADAQGVNFANLKAAMNAFVDAASASDNPAIKNQMYSLWLVNNTVIAPTSFKNSANIKADINAFPASNPAGDSILFQGVVQAIGSYKGKGWQTGSLTEYDFNNPNVNLNDGYQLTTSAASGNVPELVSSINSMDISSVVVFAAGENKGEAFKRLAVFLALEWQQLFELGSDDTGNVPYTDPSGKPFYYVALGTAAPVTDITNLATQTFATNSWTTFNFASALVTQQEKDVVHRTRLDNLYLMRIPVPIDAGSFNVRMSSKATEYKIVLRTQCSNIVTPATCVPPGAGITLDTTLEIAGPNKAYLPGGKVSVSKVTRLYPHIVWDPRDLYGSSAPSWSISQGSFTTNDDGSITISSANVGATITLAVPGLSNAVITVVN